MGKLTVYNFLTLNGYFKGLHNDLSWQRHGEEEGQYAARGAQSESALLFGRITYEMMASFWPTAAGRQLNPGVAEGMNKSEKIVFSRTLQKAEWENTRIINDDLVEATRRLKEVEGKVMTILGSGSIATQLADAGLIDEYLLMLNPVALGDGTSFLQGLTKRLDLELVEARSFKSGVILLHYRPIKGAAIRSSHP